MNTTNTYEFELKLEVNRNYSKYFSLPPFLHRRLSFMVTIHFGK